MKKSLLVLAFPAMLFSCGGGEEKQEAEEAQVTTELTEEEEMETAEELSVELQSDAEEVRQAREKSLQEVDSLLENF
ncbi:hypothetical protein AB9P05_02360 [Roseivirga sp. BDSF3-8]|uniref:hypothetical protein n=1 Tax=Roseivirga sp. BDSF3-8 TaxID=3241598 RepID=UPI0035327450